MKTCKKCMALFMSILLICFASTSVCAVDGAVSTPTVKCTNCDSELTLAYMAAKTFDFEAENLPQGASVHVFVNDADQGESVSFTVYDATEDYTVQAKAIAADGDVLASSGVIKVTVNNGLFDRLGYSARRFVRRLADALGDFFGAIFMRIYIFIMDLGR